MAVAYQCDRCKEFRAGAAPGECTLLVALGRGASCTTTTKEHVVLCPACTDDAYRLLAYPPPERGR